MSVCVCVWMLKAFKHWPCFASFLFLINTPEKGSEPFWGKISPRITALSMRNAQRQQIPHPPAEKAEAGRGRAKGQRQELQPVANITLAPQSPNHACCRTRPRPWWGAVVPKWWSPLVVPPTCTLTASMWTAARNLKQISAFGLPVTEAERDPVTHCWERLLAEFLSAATSLSRFH